MKTISTTINNEKPNIIPAENKKEIADRKKAVATYEALINSYEEARKFYEKRNRDNAIKSKKIITEGNNRIAAKWQRMEVYPYCD